MSDKSTIYEITQLMQDKTVIQNDLNEAIDTVKDIFYKKYIQKFQTALNEQKDLTRKESSKEIQLLSALKPFMKEESHESMDKMINAIYTLNTAQSINKEIKKYSVNSDTNLSTVSAASTTIHDDGVYEIDENCNVDNFSSSSTNITEIIFMLLLTGIIK